MQLVNQLQKIVGYVEVFLAETLARCDRFYAVFGNIKNDLSLVICDEYSPGPALNDAIGRRQSSISNGRQNRNVRHNNIRRFKVQHHMKRNCGTIPFIAILNGIGPFFSSAGHYINEAFKKVTFSL